MSKILVTGASGHLGGLVIRHLLETENVAASDIVAGTRDPQKLGALAAKGIEIRAVDFDKPETLEPAFAGIGKLLLISTDSLEISGKRADQIKTAATAAANASVGRIFYTSMPEPETSVISFAWEHRDSEKAIAETGRPYTFLRDNWYMENLFMGLPQAIASGQWHTSAGDGRTAFIAREDCARAIAAALVKTENDNAVYTLTGAQAYTNAEIADLAGKAVGKPIEIVAVDDAAVEGGLSQAGLPGFLVPFIVSIEKATRQGDLAGVTDDFARLTGREPVRIEDFLAANAGALKG
jgi:NAD(P)H dehydrogenase (quinone)